jgi:hypothetical protein
MYTLGDILRKNPIATVSVVFRRTVLDCLPSWTQNSPFGDYLIHLLCASNGFLAYLPHTMAVYRLHSGGIWSNQNEQQSLEKNLWFFMKLVKEPFVSAHTTAIENKIRIIVPRLFQIYLQQRNPVVYAFWWQSFLAQPKVALAYIKPVGRFFLSNLKKKWLVL